MKKNLLLRVTVMALAIVMMLPMIASAERIQINPEGFTVEIWTYRPEGEEEPGFKPEKVAEGVVGQSTRDGYGLGLRNVQIPITTTYSEFVATRQEFRYILIFCGTNVDGYTIQPEQAKAYPLGTVPQLAHDSYQSFFGFYRGGSIIKQPYEY